MHPLPNTSDLMNNLLAALMVFHPSAFLADLYGAVRMLSARGELLEPLRMAHWGE